MTTRTCDFVKNPDQIYDALEIVKLIKKNLHKLNATYSLSKKMFDKDMKKIDDVIFNYGDVTGIKQTIAKELVSNYNIEYIVERGVYPLIPSVTAKNLEKEFMAVFEIEDKYAFLVSDIWNKYLTEPKKFINGNNFNFIFEPVALNNDKLTTPFVSGIIINNNNLDFVKNKVGLLYLAEKRNFIAAANSKIDVTLKDERTPNSIKKINDKYIELDTSDSDFAVSKMTLPSSDNSLFNVFGDEINDYHFDEIIMDRTRPEAVLLLSNSSDLFLFEYIVALKLQEKFKIPIILINKKTYRTDARKTITTNEDELFQRKVAKFVRNDEIENKKYLNYLGSYIKDIVQKGQYTLETKAILKNTFERKIDNINNIYDGIDKTLINSKKS